MQKQRRDGKSAVRCNARVGQVSVSGTRPCIEIAVQLHAVSREHQNITVTGAGIAPLFYTILCTQKGNCETPFCKGRDTFLSFVWHAKGRCGWLRTTSRGVTCALDRLWQTFHPWLDKNFWKITLRNNKPEKKIQERDLEWKQNVLPQILHWQGSRKRQGNGKISALSFNNKASEWTNNLTWENTRNKERINTNTLHNKPKQQRTMSAHTRTQNGRMYSQLETGYEMHS